VPERILYPTFKVAVKFCALASIGPIRDEGLLQSALERPATTVMGRAAYPSIELKAAALMHSVCLNHALVDGNKRLAALLAISFLNSNGYDSDLDNDGLFDLTWAIAAGKLSDLNQIADGLRAVGRD